MSILAGDHQNKPDVGAASATHWYNRGNVTMITGLGNSAVALAVQAVEMAIIRMEDRYADDTISHRGFAEVFQANYAFDFNAALRNVTCPVLLVEISSDRTRSTAAEPLR